MSRVHLDWTKPNGLTPTQISNLGQYVLGGYEPPPRAHNNTSIDVHKFRHTPKLKMLKAFQMGLNSRNRSKHVRVTRAQRKSRWVGQAVGYIQTRAFIRPFVNHCAAAMASKGNSRVTWNVTPIIFSPSPTVLELRAKICSNGRQTIAIRRRYRRLNKNTLSNESIQAQHFPREQQGHHHNGWSGRSTTPNDDWSIGSRTRDE